MLHTQPRGDVLSTISPVYVETSVISYLVAKRSRDIITLARQEITSEWWDVYRKSYEVFISELVLQEAARGDKHLSAARLEALDGFPILEISNQVAEVADALLLCSAVPRKAAEDAIHIATAAVNGIEYLLTWNFKHINNVHTKQKITSCLESLGVVAPILCSPEELIGG